MSKIRLIPLFFLVSYLLMSGLPQDHTISALSAIATAAVIALIYLKNPKEATISAGSIAVLSWLNPVIGWSLTVALVLEDLWESRQ